MIKKVHIVILSVASIPVGRQLSTPCVSFLVSMGEA